MDKTIDPTQSIELSDDDDDVTTKSRKRRQSSTSQPSECLNVECKIATKYMDTVPSFVLSYYKVRRRQGLKVCEKCFDETCTYFEHLKEKYLKKESIYEVPSSKYKPVLNIDSDEEDLSSEDDEEPFDEETVEMIENNLGPVMKKIMTDNRTRMQIDDSYKHLKQDVAKLVEEYRDINDNYSSMQKQIDDLRRQIYANFRPEIKTLPGIEIIDVAHKSKGESSKLQTLMTASVAPSTSSHDKNDSSQDVVAVSEKILVPPKTLPPPGCIVSKPKLKPGDDVHIMKHSYQYPWKMGTVKSVSRDKGHYEYEIKLSSTGKRSTIVLSGKYLAYKMISPFRFVVGYRVIALFKDDRARNISKQFYSGVVAEPPTAMNRFRYLIFFDDGCAQYVPHENIRLICEPSINPWEDTPPDSRNFIKKYLLEYPERPMVKLQTGNIVRVEYQTNWLLAKVMEVDASLVNMHFIIEGRTEWIYRGSLRLQPLYKEFDVAKRRKETGDRVRRITGKLNNNSPYVEYTHNIDGEDADDSNSASSRPRSVARKSTCSSNKLHKTEKVEKCAATPVPGTLDLKKLENVLEPKKFVAHQCTPLCVQWTQFDNAKMKNVSPLEVPLHYGFRSGVKKSVLYKAPCGRSLRNMEEVHVYLRITKSEMTVDRFDFDYWVNILAEFNIKRTNVNIPDITYGKENCPISCVNYIDKSLPVFSSYLTEREPRENVDLNLDPEFLCGCDCTDDCQDREKCSCWQMTIEGQKLIPNNDVDPNVGYHYRRLPERVITGIYECNQQCKCSKVTCLNRVVQYPLSQKLQLFKTQMKGWGIRCLNDIPQGSFICVYAGHLLTEHEANEEGKNYGDEYLAELDYIEVIESTKQDYESDVPEDLEEDLKEIRSKKNDTGGRNEDDSPTSSTEDGSVEMDVESEGSYKSRLRERKSNKRKDSKVTKEQPKEKEKKKEKLFSIRKYYGDNEDEVFIMDAKCSGNIGRYLNHSCMPNVFVQNVFVDTHDLRFPWVAFFAQTYIIAGTELTWDYNYDIGSVEGKIKYCYCGSVKCRGRLL